MSRDEYNPVTSSGVRSPGRVRRLQELPTVDRSPSRDYGAPRGSPLAMGSPYYRDMDEPTSPAGAGHHRSRSASRPPMAHAMDYPRTRYQSLDRGGLVDPHDREFIPIREPRDRSRDRSLERGLYLEDELYGRSARQSPSAMGGYNTGMGPTSDRAYLGDLQHQNTDLQRELGNLKRELELTNQKLGSSMHSIKTFWSPELKKERALRKEESAKYSLINDQLKLLSTENQKQAMLVRQLEEELRLRMRQPNLEMQQQMEAIYAENDHLQREISILRETIKDLECRVETQKQTLIARDESIKKLLEMLQAKGMGKEEERQMFQQMQAMAQKQLDLEREIKKFAQEEQGVRLDEFRLEIQRRDQEILAMAAKMKTLEEQHQRHIAVLKESLCAKEEHYNMLQTDVEEMRARLEEKNRLIEKKTQGTLQTVQERNRLTSELTEIKDHMDIKDRKISVLQRKIENLEDLLKEKDNQVDMARARLSAMQAHHSSSEGALTSLEEAIGDKEKQMAQLRDQRDRAEHEKQEERDLHEREVADYKIKLRAAESEVEKLQTRLERAVTERERLEIKLEASQSELGKSKAELEKATCEMGRSSADWESTKQRIARLELENERLKHDLERSQVLVLYR
ncbi:uncharacterized protein Dyak_GE19282, isoform H [Drosophila yakuba]|uniref:Uncharacterized protein, isoform H n=1 Tax=Drosophila yakuba TaxID=7245 RepID=A0A0R1DMN7_DROYA|nr:uncharacterized protein Dyak_GE19282, isoform H [Drosophila yakuba]